MSMYELCEWLQNTRLGTAIGEHPWLFPTFETVHVLALTLVMGSIAVVDLRLLGWASTKVSVKQLTDETLPYTWIAFVVAAISGALLFTSNATTYYNSIHYRIKFVLLALAGINMLIFHLGEFRNAARWAQDVKPPAAARLAGGLSLMLWIGVVTFGRLVGFFV